MEFRTVIKPDVNKGLISHASRMVMLGSCFSDSIGNKLKENLFNVCVNPFGTLYNAASIASVIERIANPVPFSEKDLIVNGNLYCSWLSHSSLSSSSPSKAVEMLNLALDNARKSFEVADIVIITLGTSYVFNLKENGLTVANCHKFPANIFERTKLSVDETVNWIKRIIAAVHSLSAKAKLIFTVSPIRHTADGLHGNQISKATMLLAIDRICHTHSDTCSYFPAYEALIDDLRDYRFYDSDMKHPSSVAVDYIYNLFSDAFFNESTKQLEKEARSLTKRLTHKMLTDDNLTISQFNNKTALLTEALLQRNPEITEALQRFTKTIES